jgi:hypothetical protein
MRGAIFSREARIPANRAVAGYAPALHPYRIIGELYKVFLADG